MWVGAAKTGRTSYGSPCCLPQPCRIEWDEPSGGTGHDLFVLSEDGNAMEQRSSVTVGGKTVDYVSRFNRVV